MMKNMGPVDRVIRALIGVVLVVAGIVLGGLWLLLLIPALIMFATAAVGFCPLYVPFKIDTRSKTEKRKTY